MSSFVLTPLSTLSILPFPLSLKQAATLYGNGLPVENARALTPKTKMSFGTCKACKKENIDVTHNSWPADEVLYTPVKRYYGWCAKCFERETYVDPATKKHGKATPGDFPVMRTESGVGVREERLQLLGWLKGEIKRRRIGSSRLLGLMDQDRSVSASLNEFTAGLKGVDIDLEREDYMRLFKAVDIGGDRAVTLVELASTLYGDSSEDNSNHCVEQKSAFGTCKMCKKQNTDLTHVNWPKGKQFRGEAYHKAWFDPLHILNKCLCVRICIITHTISHTENGSISLFLTAGHVLHTPVKSYYGRCIKCFTKEGKR